jgi:hypothetical protein
MSSLESLRGNKDKTNRDFSYCTDGRENYNPIVLMQKLKSTLVPILAIIV